PDGRLLAVGPRAHIWKPNGSIFYSEIKHPRVGFSGQKVQWGWSPVASCLVDIYPGMSGALSVTVLPPEDPQAVSHHVLMRGGVRNFSFSPDGASLAVFTNEGEPAVQIIDLQSNVMDKVMTLPEQTCCVTFAGWADSDVLFWAEPSGFVAGGGWKLQGVGLGGSVRLYAPTMYPDPRAIERCGDDVVAIVGEAASNQAPPVRRYLKRLRPDRFPRNLYRNGDAQAWPACDPAGQLALVVLKGKGYNADGQIQIVKDGEALKRFSFPTIPSHLDWGPAGTGLVFLVPERERCHLWIIKTSDTPERLDVAVPCRSMDTSDPWDWSVTPPDGLPARRWIFSTQS
ncbi:MAG: hypothetical protein ACRDI3_06355, partial [Actinomycetota bacterium]